jgi:hypothetical protein
MPRSKRQIDSRFSTFSAAATTESAVVRCGGFQDKQNRRGVGAGYGFTPGSDRFTLKAILGYAFPVLKSNNGDDNSSPSSLKMGAQTRPLQNAWTLTPAI